MQRQEGEGEREKKRSSLLLSLLKFLGWDKGGDIWSFKEIQVLKLIAWDCLIWNNITWKRDKQVIALFCNTVWKNGSSKKLNGIEKWCYFLSPPYTSHLISCLNEIINSCGVADYVHTWTAFSLCVWMPQELFPSPRSPHQGLCLATPLLAENTSSDMFDRMTKGWAGSQCATSP